jgi:hypothetical protein
MIVIGFVGWILKHDDTRRSEVKLSEHLRRDYPDTVVTAVFEHYKGGQAHALIMRELNPQVKPFQRVMFFSRQSVGHDPVLIDRIAFTAAPDSTETRSPWIRTLSATQAERKRILR